MTWTFKSWWEKHKTERNAARRAQYRKDPEYRVRALALTAAWRDRHRKNEVGMWARKSAASKSVNRRIAHRKVGRYALVGINEVAARAKLSPQTLRRWEQLGVIDTLWRDSFGHLRLEQKYAEKLVQLVERGREEMWSTARLAKELLK